METFQDASITVPDGEVEDYDPSSCFLVKISLYWKDQLEYYPMETLFISLKEDGLDEPTCWWSRIADEFSSLIFPSVCYEYLAELVSEISDSICLQSAGDQVHIKVTLSDDGIDEDEDEEEEEDSDNAASKSPATKPKPKAT